MSIRSITAVSKAEKDKDMDKYQDRWQANVATTLEKRDGQSLDGKDEESVR